MHLVGRQAFFGALSVLYESVITLYNPRTNIVTTLYLYGDGMGAAVRMEWAVKLRSKVSKHSV